MTNAILQLVSDFPGLPANAYLRMQCADDGQVFRNNRHPLTAAVLRSVELLCMHGRGRYCLVGDGSQQWHGS